MNIVHDKLMLGVVNYRSIWHNKQKNIEKMTRFIVEAAEKKCQFLLFPELCITGYRNEDPCDAAKHTQVQNAEPVFGETTQYFMKLAQKYKMYIAYGMSEAIEGEDRLGYNTAVVVAPDGAVHPYQKMHPTEGSWCKAGDTPCLIDTPWGPIGVSIGCDYCVPELTRYYGAMGARLLLNLTANTAIQRDSTGWQWPHRRRLETLVDRESIYVASANLLREDSFSGRNRNRADTFSGGSVIIAPIPSKGSFVSLVGGGFDNTKEGVYCANIDLSKASLEVFQSPVYKPALYTKWYASMPAKPVYSKNARGKIKLAASNFHPKWGDKQHNLQQLCAQVKIAAAQGVNIVTFPEMSLTGYAYFLGSAEHIPMQRRLAEPIPGPSTQILSELAIKHDIYIVVGMPERGLNGKIYNSAAVLTPKGEILSYKKIHPVGEEHNWCYAGTKPLLFDTPWGAVGVSICYDTYYFPELTRYYAANGAKIIINPTASSKGSLDGRWHWYYSGRLECTTDRDGVLLVSANLCGVDGNGEKNMHFKGGSVILSTCCTKPILHAGAYQNEKEGLLISEAIDISKISFKASRFNPSLYSKLYHEIAEKMR